MRTADTEIERSQGKLCVTRVCERRHKCLANLPFRRDEAHLGSRARAEKIGKKEFDFEESGCYIRREIPSESA